MGRRGGEMRWGDGDGEVGWGDGDRKAGWGDEVGRWGGEARLITINCLLLHLLTPLTSPEQPLKLLCKQRPQTRNNGHCFLMENQ